MASLFTSSKKNSPDLINFPWGKLSAGGGGTHPAIYHAIDVGHIAEAILSESASSRWHNALAYALNADKTLQRLLPWVVSLHDIGKFSAAFQKQIGGPYEEMKRQGLGASGNGLLNHSQIGQIVIGDLLDGQVPSTWVEILRETIGGHHGRFQNIDRRTRRQFRVIQEAPAWDDLRQAVVDVLTSLFLKGEIEWPDPSNISAAIYVLTGFVNFCDWMGSDENYFPPFSHINREEYIQHSKKQAHRKLKDEGYFFNTTASKAPVTFRELFPDVKTPTWLQRAIDDIPTQYLSGPSLTIIEAPPGEGRTDAALALARRYAVELGHDEVYYALPTMALANQMTERLQQHLKGCLGIDLPIRTVHSRLYESEPYCVQKQTPENRFNIELQISNAEPQPQQCQTTITPKQNRTDRAAYSRIMAQRMAFIAPFSVGTIDQLEMIALNTRFGAIRAIGLAGKTIILDGVDTYDIYMNTVVEHVLRWLAAIGCKVIMLATVLSRKQRTAFLDAFGVNDLDWEQAKDYPLLLTGSSQGVYRATGPANSQRRAFDVQPLHFAETETGAKDVARWLNSFAEEGMVVYWAANTISRAQEIFAHVCQIADGIEAVLLHGQLPDEVQRTAEQRIAEGSNRKRSAGAIIVSTQSLPLRVDLFAADLVPINILLSRLEGLDFSNRFLSGEGVNPIVHINALEDGRGELIINRSHYLGEYPLRRTWQFLREMSTITLPDDARHLVEAICCDDPPAGNKALRMAWDEMRFQEQYLRDKAILNLIPAPDPGEPFTWGLRHTSNDDLERGWGSMGTRHNDSLVNVIPLIKLLNGKAQLYPLDETVDLKNGADIETQLRLLGKRVRVSCRALANWAAEYGELPPLFAESELLAGIYPLFLDENGQVVITAGDIALQIKMDEKLGLIIEAQER